MHENARLDRGMMWRSWRTVSAIPYSVLSCMGIPAELSAASLADILREGTLDSNADLDSVTLVLDLECFYRDDFQEEDMEDWTGDERTGQDPMGSPGRQVSGSIGEYKIDDPAKDSLLEPPEVSPEAKTDKDKPPT
ncbi:hypothetical protein CBR_g32437 [Chara braunii]|uniref:Uncharacterized protein n=1 Tax=Chara braunii TaxID=69332 RepID=A0A388JYG8_CHABU|nr:hypothetical protein CBR_g32437 [Chara braunii]|eukprot:GBG62854.1 hypothetical protein CBR_g32437 [Chara braunii]